MKGKCDETLLQMLPLLYGRSTELGGRRAKEENYNFKAQQ